ncbi:MAG: right-handed parallel beta-helix repeat-containing protein [Candidatus Helarchaeota archaeon]
MKHIRKLLVFLTLASLLGIAYLQIGTSDLASIETRPATTLGIQQLYPIEINGNSDFSKYASAGDGNLTTPWVIEDKVIINATTDYGIYIADTTDHFVIENCTIELGHETDKNAIGLDNVTSGNITNNRLGAFVGIEIRGSGAIHLADNLINFTEQGMHIWGSSNLNISATTAFEFTPRIGTYGIWLSIVDDFLIHNNNISGASNGIEVDDGSNGIVLNNTMNGTGEGVGIDVYGSFVQVLNNTVNNHNDGIEVSGNNFTVKYNWATFNIQRGIYLLSAHNNTIAHNTVQNITASEYRNGILLVDSNDNLLEWNTITKNRGTQIISTTYGNGIRLDHSHNNTLKDNTIFHSECAGICISNSDDNIITQNTIKYNNLDGMFLWYAENNEVTHNTINDNGGYGIKAPPGAASIGNIIRWNTILNNDDGCLDIDTENNTVSDNTCKAGIPGFLWIFTLCGLLVVIWQVLLKNRKPQGCL